MKKTTSCKPQGLANTQVHGHDECRVEQTYRAQNKDTGDDPEPSAYGIGEEILSRLRVVAQADNMASESDLIHDEGFWSADGASDGKKDKVSSVTLRSSVFIVRAVCLGNSE